MSKFTLNVVETNHAIHQTLLSPRWCYRLPLSHLSQPCKLNHVLSSSGILLCNLTIGTGTITITAWLLSNLVTITATLSAYCMYSGKALRDVSVSVGAHRVLRTRIAYRRIRITGSSTGVSSIEASRGEGGGLHGVRQAQPRSESKSQQSCQA